MALELDPQASEAWTLLAQFQRACCLKEVGYQSLLQAIKLQPLKNPVARKLLLQWLNEDRSDARINQSQLGHWLFKLEHKVLYQVGKTFSSPTPKVEDTALLAPLPTVASEPNEAAPPTLAAYDDLPQAPMPPVLPPIQGAAADNSSLPTVASPEEQQQALKHILALEVQWSQQGDNTDLALELAETCLQHQAYVKALYYVRTAINQAPNHAKAYTLMAKVVHAMGDKEGCTEAYRSAIAFAEDNLWAATTAAQLGQYYWQELADSEQAITCYHMAQELDPDELEHPFALAELYCDLNRLADACTIYEQLRERQSDNAELHCFLGYLYWSLQRCEEAAEAYQTCLQLEPNNPIACNNLGVFYLDETQELPKALGYFERALRLKPSYTMAHFNQGRTLEALNHKSEALAAFEKALRCNVQEPEVEEAKLRERITQLKQA
jgi:tetratricopeptide (TPR) repeat protein